MTLALAPAPAPTPGALLPLVGTSDFNAELGRLLDTLDAAQLFAVESMCLRRQSAKYTARLLTVLRRRARQIVAEGETDSRWPVVAVTFGTWGWDNGIFWKEYEVALRHLDGTVSRVDLGYDDVSGLLADLAGTDRPDHGDRLTVDLRTGTVLQ
ncbi:hypothetical protein [Streptomyces sp. NPDC055912]|uniref:hypothetical protein n=1 Tax=Streptomyces sp. NPDC055912 TaxID=3345660 RepID=UPI0035E27DF4